MVSIEYQLARITAQSKWADPKIIRGGLPELTPDDVRAAVSMATSPYTYRALMAKYCHCKKSEAYLYEMLEVHSWLHFGDRHPKQSISREENQKLTECAVLYYLAPDQGVRRGDSGHAAHMGIHRNTWSAKFKQHFKEITGFLFELEQAGVREVLRMLRRGSPM